MAFIGKDSVTVTSLDSAESMSVVTDLTVDTNTLKVDSTANRVGILNATPDVTLDVGSATDAIHIPVGTTAERPGTPSSGYFRFNTSLNQFEGYTNIWGAIGGGGTNTFTHDSFTGDNTTTDFILSQSTESENNLFVFIDGVFQTQDAYSIATAAGQTTLTLSAPPATGRKIIVYTVAAGVSGNNLNQNRFDGLTSDAVDGLNTTFTLSIPPVNKNNTQVFFDGVYQHKENYSVSGTTLTFTDAPPLGVVIEVMIFTQTEVNVPVDDSITSAKLSGDLTTPGNLTVTGYLAGPATFIIDPAAVGDDTGTVQIKGNLQVDGTQTTINSTTLEVDDLNITIASGAADALSADGAGITVDGASATLTYVNSGDNWNFNKSLDVTGTVTADGVLVGDSSSSFTLAVIQSSTSGESELRMGDTDTDAGSISYTNSDDTMTFRAAAAARMSLNSTGLDVTGTVTADGLTVLGTDTALVASIGTDAQRVYITPDGTEINYNASGNSAGSHMFQTGNVNRLNIASNGDISFYEDTGTTAKFFWDASAESLGIGTSSPTRKLHVNSGTTDTAVLIESTDAVSIINMKDSTSTGDGISFGVNGDALIFNSGLSTERMRIDSSGNVGIGGITPTGLLTLGTGTFSAAAANTSALYTSTTAGLVAVADGLLLVDRAGADVFKVDTSGNVGIGVAPASDWRSGQSLLQVNNGSIANYIDLATNIFHNVYFDSSNDPRYIATNKGAFSIGLNASESAITFSYGPNGTAGAVVSLSESMRIDSSGNLLVGTPTSAGKLTVEHSSTSTPAGFFNNNNSGSSGVQVLGTSLPSTANNTNCYHLKSTTQGVSSYYLYGDGSSSFTSDERQKKNIVTTRDGYLDDLKNLRVVDYHWNNQEDTEDKNIGLVAQEVEQVFPNLVVEHELEGAGVRKNLKGSDFTFILIKAIQEQQDLIESLTARIAALESN